MKLIVLSGRLTADPEFREVGEKQSRLASFRLANNDSDKDQGQFYQVHCWNRQAEFVEAYLKKGQKIVVAGSFDNKSYKDTEGANRTAFSITANQIEFAE